MTLKRTLFLGLGLVFGLLILIPAGLLGLMASESGSRWLLLSLEPMLPLKLDPTAIKGPLLGHLRLGNIEIKADPHRGSLKQLELDWQPGRLLAGELRVKRLLIAGLDFYPGESAPKQPDANTIKCQARSPHPDPLPKGEGERKTATEQAQEPCPDSSLHLALPIKVFLDDIRLEDASIHQGERPQIIDRLALKVSTQDERLVLESLELVAAPLKQLKLKAALGLNPPNAIEAQLGWQLELPEMGALSGQGRIGGTLEKILLEHLVTAPFSVTTKGSIGLGQVPDINLINEWQSVQWPLSGPAKFSSKAGRLAIQGPVESYRLQLQTSLSGSQIPATDMEISGQGSTESFRIQKLLVKLLGGEIDIKGSAGWAPHPAWNLALAAKDLQPGKQWPEVPGSFSLRLASQGELIDGKPKLQAKLTELKGLINQLALEGQGLVHLDGERLQLDGLTITAGKNHIRMQGELAKTADFEGIIEAPELARLWPGLKGSLNAKTRIKGELTAPDLHLEAKGSGLGFAEHGLKSLDASIRWNPQDTRASSTSLSLKGLSSGKPLLDSLSLAGPGNLASHQWKLALTGPDITANLGLTGGLLGSSWQGQLTSGEVKSKEAGHWQLAKAFGLSLGADGQLGSHCWQSRGGSVCLDGRWDSEQQFAANATLKAIPLAILEPFLPKGERISGNLNGQLKANGSFQKPRATLELQLPECSYQPNIPNTKVSLQLRQLGLAATLADELLKADLTFGIKIDTPKAPGAWGKSQSQLGLRLGAKPRLEPSSLKLEYPDIANIGFLVPAISKLKGRLALDLKAQGALDRPSLNGGLRLLDAGLELPDTGIKIEGLALSALAAGGQQLDIAGQASSGGGRLNLKGRLELAGTKPKLDMQLKGQDFQVARIPMAEVNISPDLIFGLKDGNFDIGGSLLVPKAIIKLKELPEGSVAVSDDVVILDDSKPKTAKKEELPPALFKAKIDLRLGEEVRFSGFGLKTKIQGRLNIESTPGLPPMGNGNLNLVDGSFKAYGQDLRIERGRFLFSGPLDQPGLDIQASRTAKNEDVKAGVLVTGPVKNPEVKVFSVPPKPTSEALSYLLTGSGLKSASPDQAKAINSAAYSMQQAGANMLTGKIAKGLGLSDFSFGGESAESSALNLGKQLSPDLYVRYVRNLFDNSAAMEVGYKINKVLDLKVYGGSSQGLDLYYHKEK